MTTWDRTESGLVSSVSDSYSGPPESDPLAAATVVSLAGDPLDDTAPEAALERRGWDRVLLSPLRGRPLIGATIVAVILLCVTAVAAWFSTDSSSPARHSARSSWVQRIGASSSTPAEAGAESAADPAFRLQDLSPNEAEIYNAGVPISTDPNPAALPFHLEGASAQDQLRATDCLAAAVYYEAASEPLAGQQAVAQVVLNRLRDPHYPRTVCGVVFQGVELPTGWQFTFVGDGSLARKPSVQGWALAQKVAAAALHGFVAKPVGEATHYHTVWVAPYWSPTLLKVANIGAHIFYRWAGNMGSPRAFTGRYAGGEPLLAQITALDPAVMDVEFRPAGSEANKIVVVQSAPTLQPAAQIGTSADTADKAPAPAGAPPEAASAAATPTDAAGAAAPKISKAIPDVQVRPPPPKDTRPNWSRLPTGSGW
jgi:spore germination cell wall hydrolase CwlJ-like protein